MSTEQKEWPCIGGCWSNNGEPCGKCEASRRILAQPSVRKCDMCVHFMDIQFGACCWAALKREQS